MKYYVYIQENTIIGKGLCTCSTPNTLNIEVTKEVCDNLDHYIWDGSEIILDPDYDEKQRQKEQERIKMLSCTKRDFALLLQEQGITYAQLKALIAQNEQAQLEWELCERLYRFNPLLDIMGAQLGVSSETLDYIFRKANGEIEDDV